MQSFQKHCCSWLRILCSRHLLPRKGLEYLKGWDPCCHLRLSKWEPPRAYPRSSPPHSRAKETRLVAQPQAPIERTRRKVEAQPNCWSWLPTPKTYTTPLIALSTLSTSYQSGHQSFQLFTPFLCPLNLPGSLALVSLQELAHG